ncbi:MAG TPA: hypothetical protein PK725_10010 [Rhodocyclaceae bacterium]|nr:hypothetical protein [Rhodocyclaceae bacterium]HRQ47273.1 hypothetical protein [Rhodocyclaceae bacterium]
MITSILKSLRPAVVALTLLAATGAVTAQELHQHATAGGIDIYYGFLPAQVATRQTAPHDAEPMHGKPRRGDSHLMVGLYDREGERIDEADVRATVGELGMAGTRKPLEPMVVGDTITFGNYFPMRSAGHYRVVLEVRLPGAPMPVEVRFDHQHR